MALPLLDMTAAPRSLTDDILDQMTTILVAAQSVTLQLEAAENLSPADREAVLRAAARISAQADWVLAWLMETPLETIRH